MELCGGVFAQSQAFFQQQREKACHRVEEVLRLARYCPVFDDPEEAHVVCGVPQNVDEVLASRQGRVWLSRGAQANC